VRLAALVPVWFAVAALLAVTRALLTAHFLSDVLIGAGIGLIAAREVLQLGFPGLRSLGFSILPLPLRERTQNLALSGAHAELVLRFC